MLIKRLYFIATALLTFSVCSCGESYPDHPWEWDQAVSYTHLTLPTKLEV